MFKVPEKYRIKTGLYGSDESFGCNGAFSIPHKKASLHVVASGEMGWEHVSVSHSGNRTPTWAEMCMVKDLFWDDEDVVVQYHPAKSNYVNFHSHTLHLWRKVGTEDWVDMPPEVMV